MCMFRDTSEKWGLSYTNQEKWGQSYTFCLKKGPIKYLTALKKGGYSVHPYYAIYRKLPTYHFCVCVKRPFPSHIVVLLYTAITQDQAAENNLRIWAFLKYDPHNEQYGMIPKLLFFRKRDVFLRSKMQRSVVISMHIMFTVSFSRFKMASSICVTTAACFGLF